MLKNNEKKPIVYIDMDGVLVDFEGEHILFGSRDFPDWEAVLDRLL